MHRVFLSFIIFSFAMKNSNLFNENLGYIFYSFNSITDIDSRIAGNIFDNNLSNNNNSENNNFEKKEKKEKMKQFDHA